MEDGGIDVCRAVRHLYMFSCFEGVNKKAPCDRHSHLAGMFRGDGGCHHSKGP